jgi:hypothetical protein
MPATLCIHLPDQPALLRVFDERTREVSIGRDPSNVLALQHVSVSRCHAAMRYDGAHWSIEDTGSTNGVRIGGHAVTRQRLRHGDWFSLGDAFCEFRVVDEAEVRASSIRAEQRRQSSGIWLERLAEASDRDALMAGLMAAIMQLAECRRGFLLAGDLERGLTTAACCNLDPARPGQREFAGSSGAIMRALHLREPVLVSDPAALDWARGRPSVIAGNLRALVALPIVKRGQVLGVAYADSDEPGKVFTELDHEILSAFAAQAALLLAARGLDDALARIESCILTDTEGRAEASVPAARWTQPA